MKADRPIPVPSLFLEDYQWILLALNMIQSDILQGKKIRSTSHAVSRALVKRFTNFRVADGYSPGSERFHSWLVWKRDERFIIDPWPLSGLPGCAPPVAYIQGVTGLVYLESELPENLSGRKLVADVSSFSRRLDAMMEELSHAYTG